MKKTIAKILSAALAVCMLVSAMAVASSASFVDVPEDTWYSRSVAFCEVNNIMVGMGDEKFCPNAKVSRGQMCQILSIFGLANLGNISNVDFFKDVKKGAWYYAAVQWAADTCLVSGIGNGLFDPDGTVTREQLATFLYSLTSEFRRVNGEQVVFDNSQRADISGYTDCGAISDWAKTPIEWAVAIGLMSGTDLNTFSPKGEVTRAQVSLVVEKFCEFYAEDYLIPPYDFTIILDF